MIRLHRLPSFATLACLVTACAAPDGPADPVDAAYLFPRPGRATLIVARASEAYDDDCAYTVAIDAADAGPLTRTGWVTMYPPAGGHVVSVRTAGPACPGATEFRTRLAADQHQRLVIERTATGALQWKDERVAP